MIAGLDLSTRFLDFVVIEDPDDPARCEHRRVELPSPWWEAARGMGGLMERNEARWSIVDGPNDTQIEDWLMDKRVELLGIERPYGPSRQAIASLHVILGAVLATVPPWITVLEVRPAEMRQALGLPGNASKEALHVRVNQATAPPETPGYGPLAGKPDALDAWAVAHAAMRMCDRAAEKGAA